MRPTLCFLLVALAGFALAQDTSFPVGPQYLVTTGSPMSLQPIATPSLSFSSAIPDAYAGATELAPSQISSSTATTASNSSLAEVFWGEHKPGEIAARRIVTPSLTADETLLYAYETANVLSTPPPSPSIVSAEMPAQSGVIEITSAQLPANLPASIFDPGVTGTADAQSLLNRGYGVSLGEFAARWKTQKKPARRVFTNEDLRRP